LGLRIKFRAIAERSKGKGALHHQFAVEDGFVLVNDEWESAEEFTKFFSAPWLQTLIRSVGGDTSAAPEITVGEAVNSSDKF
jgi:hypothetical protein